jgi:hypothetical protein
MCFLLKITRTVIVEGARWTSEDVRAAGSRHQATCHKAPVSGSTPYTVPVTGSAE